MLYLVRKLNESIIIDNDVEIKVVEIKKNSVKLGVTFPNTTTVLRKEIHERIMQENLQAINSFKDIESE
ncbi:MAG: carbon storage regulator CsrA [Alphaproteobacteria bacterium]|jgi:carbon storage regulator|nr:carbon storage regulator CsrA [Candidatus Jidaibacter sp.]